MEMHRLYRIHDTLHIRLQRIPPQSPILMQPIAQRGIQLFADLVKPLISGELPYRMMSLALVLLLRCCQSASRPVRVPVLAPFETCAALHPWAAREMLEEPAACC